PLVSRPVAGVFEVVTVLSPTTTTLFPYTTALPILFSAVATRIWYRLAPSTDAHVKVGFMDWSVASRAGVNGVGKAVVNQPWLDQYPPASGLELTARLTQYSF